MTTTTDTSRVVEFLGVLNARFASCVVIRCPQFYLRTVQTPQVVPAHRGHPWHGRRRSSLVKTTPRALITSTTVLALMAATLPAASATPDPVETTANLIEQVAPDQGQVLAGTKAGNQVTTTTDSKVTVPLDPNAAITLENTNDPADSPSLEIVLPTEITPTEASSEVGTFPTRFTATSSAEKNGRESGSLVHYARTISPSALGLATTMSGRG